MQNGKQAEVPKVNSCGNVKELSKVHFAIASEEREGKGRGKRPKDE